MFAKWSTERTEVASTDRAMRRAAPFSPLEARSTSGSVPLFARTDRRAPVR